MDAKQNFSLKNHNTFGIDFLCHEFYECHSENEIIEALKQTTNQKRLILGGGSNVLPIGDFNGSVIAILNKGIEIVSESEDEVIVKANAGECWHEFVLWAIENNYGGIENLSLIPGNVGASPMQNIGAYGVEIKDVFVSLEAIDMSNYETKTFHLEECEFGYRSSIFKTWGKEKYIITSVNFRLAKKHMLNSSYGDIEKELLELKVAKPTIKDISQAVINIRMRKLPNPKEIGNAGSFFKNPVIAISHFEELKKKYETIIGYPVQDGIKVAAGWLIENAGWKGKTFDNYGVHKNQALVLVNYGGAKGKDIYDLSTQIVNDIKNKFGIELEREVNIVGL